jgi:hypothetical protein
VSTLRPIAAWLAFSLVALGGAAGCENLYLDLDEVALNVGDGGTVPGDGAIEPDGPSDIGTGTGGFDSSDGGGGDSGGGGTGGDTGGVDDTGMSGPADTAKDTSPIPKKDTGYSRPSYGCFEMTNCAALECPDYGSRCMGSILAEGPKQDRDDARQLTSCLDQKQCDFFNGSDCVETYCRGTRDACYDKIPLRVSGLSCSEVMLCRRLCTSPQCREDCTTRAGLSGSVQYEDLERCVADKCEFAAPGKVTECVRNQCRDQMRTCMGCPLRRR